jgi:hypothetical protein
VIQVTFTSETQVKNLLAFLDRVDVKGRAELVEMLTICQCIERALQPANPENGVAKEVGVAHDVVET